VSVDHYPVSSDFDPRRVNQGGMTLGNIILFRMDDVHRRASLIEARKNLPDEPATWRGTRAKAAERPLSSAASLESRCSAISTLRSPQSGGANHQR